jgi:GNAT superfamily N-acetyltransferase
MAAESHFMAGPVQIEIRELRPELVSDYLNFFDKAFSDFPDWAGCYCGFYDTPGTSWDPSANAAPEHRRTRSERISGGKVHGLLAYVQGKPIGWCNAQPRTLFVNMRSYKAALTDPSGDVGSIMCFLVAPDYRGKGVCTALLNAACDKFHRDGLKIAEGYPSTLQKRSVNIPWAEANYKGPLDVYLRNGFAIHQQFERFAIVRKNL